MDSDIERRSLRENTSGVRQVGDASASMLAIVGVLLLYVDIGEEGRSVSQAHDGEEGELRSTFCHLS